MLTKASTPERTLYHTWGEGWAGLLKRGPVRKMPECLSTQLPPAPASAGWVEKPERGRWEATRGPQAASHQSEGSEVQGVCG